MKKDVTALQAKVILSRVRPRDLVGKTRKMLALEHWPRWLPWTRGSRAQPRS